MKLRGHRPPRACRLHEGEIDGPIVEAARHNGLRSMREDGERLVAQGITSLEEVLRVTRD